MESLAVCTPSALKRVVLYDEELLMPGEKAHNRALAVDRTWVYQDWRVRIARDGHCSHLSRLRNGKNGVS